MRSNEAPSPSAMIPVIATNRADANLDRVGGAYRQALQGGCKQEKADHGGGNADGARPKSRKTILYFKEMARTISRRPAPRRIAHAMTASPTKLPCHEPQPPPIGSQRQRTTSAGSMHNWCCDLVDASAKILFKSVDINASTNAAAEPQCAGA
jgi:hypothetical protein